MITSIDYYNMEDKIKLRRFIGSSTILIYFNTALTIALIGPTLLDLISLVSITHNHT